MYRVNIVSTNPTGSVQQQQQQQQHQQQSSSSQQPPHLALVQQQSTGGIQTITATTATIIGLTSLDALNATTITGLAAAAAAAGGGSSTSAIAGSNSATAKNTVATTATKHILKAAANNNNISIVKIGDEIMLKAVKVEPIPADSGGSATSSGVTVTAIPASAVTRCEHCQRSRDLRREASFGKQ